MFHFAVAIVAIVAMIRAIAGQTIATAVAEILPAHGLAFLGAQKLAAVLVEYVAHHAGTVPRHPQWCFWSLMLFPFPRTSAARRPLASRNPRAVPGAGAGGAVAWMPTSQPAR